MSAERLQENLNRLMGELETMPSLGGTAGGISTCTNMASKMPLANSASRKSFAAICGSGSLLSKRQLAIPGNPVDPACAEAKLGTDDCVFLFVGPFRYLDTECGFLFKAELADSRHDVATATPFDSGGLLHHHAPLNDVSPEECFACHELPVPQYRTYHALVLDRLFDDPWDYLDGIPSASANPIRLDRTGADARSWTFELRVRSHVPIRTHLQAVFISTSVISEVDAARPLPPTGVGIQHVGEMLEWCGDNNVDIEVYPAPTARDPDGFMAMQNKSVTYIRELIDA